MKSGCHRYHFKMADRTLFRENGGRNISRTICLIIFKFSGIVNHYNGHNLSWGIRYNSNHLVIAAYFWKLPIFQIKYRTKWGIILCLTWIKTKAHDKLCTLMWWKIPENLKLIELAVLKIFLPPFRKNETEKMKF